MQSRAARLGVLATVIVAAVVGFIVLKNDNGDSNDNGEVTVTNAEGVTTTENPVQMLRVDASGNPVGGVKTLTVNKGDQVRLEVTLARPEEEIHVHGYDKEAPAEKSPVRLSFPANIDGIFEIEVHHPDGTEAEIAELRVNP
jgi:FtsP/CotA-like multicopper oxidase with cupredoxin domain